MLNDRSVAWLAFAVGASAAGRRGAEAARHADDMLEQFESRFAPPANPTQHQPEPEAVTPPVATSPAAAPATASTPAPLPATDNATPPTAPPNDTKAAKKGDGK